MKQSPFLALSKLCVIMKSKTVVVRTYRILKWIVVVVVVLTFFARAIINIAKETQAQVPQIKLKTHPPASFRRSFCTTITCNATKGGSTWLERAELPPRDTTTPELGRVEIVFAVVYGRCVAVVDNDSRNATPGRVRCGIKQTLSVEHLSFETVVLTKAAIQNNKQALAKFGSDQS